MDLVTHLLSLTRHLVDEFEFILIINSKSFHFTGRFVLTFFLSHSIDKDQQSLLQEV